MEALKFATKWLLAATTGSIAFVWLLSMPLDPAPIETASIASYSISK